MQGPHYHTYTSIHTPRYTENAKPDFVPFTPTPATEL